MYMLWSNRVPHLPDRLFEDGQGRVQGERNREVAPGHPKTEIESTDFTEIFASLKSRKVRLCIQLLYEIKKTAKENNFHNPNSSLLKQASRL
jgi:hypothetical protein